MVVSAGLLLPAAWCEPEEEPAHRGNEIQRLRAVIQYHNDLYFRQNAPEISDAEYDRLCQRLRQMEAGQADMKGSTGTALSLLGDDRSVPDSGCAHKSPMLSLQKCYSPGEALELYETWLQGTGAKELTVRLEPKVDGVAINAIYEDGRLSRVLSRGDGKTGEDLTKPVLETGCLPLVLAGGQPPPAVLELRGEAFIRRQTFLEINEQRRLQGKQPFASERNLAAGTLRHSDLSVIKERGLEIVIFTTGHWLPIESMPDNESEAVLCMRKWGLPLLDHIRWARNRVGLEKAILQMESESREWSYPVDGIVMELERYSDRQLIGWLADGPRWAAACKFPAAQTRSILREIIWQHGKTGKITPVARFDPVVINGRTITRASLYNEKHVLENGYKPGDSILVELRGDVIPVISKP